MKGNVKEEALLIEFPENIPEMEEIEQQPENSENQIESAPSAKNNTTNAASNQMASENTTSSPDKFFDDLYRQEMEAAQKLRSDVNSQLSKEVVGLDDIKMPVQTTEGMDRDSIKNEIFVGESNIVYYLENRYHLSLPIPVYLSQGGGKVIVDIVVDRQGKVIEASPRENTKIRDKQIFTYAQAAASRTVFNPLETAPNKQHGTIHYTFIAQ